MDGLTIPGLGAEQGTNVGKVGGSLAIRWGVASVAVSEYTARRTDDDRVDDERIDVESTD